MREAHLFPAMSLRGLAMLPLALAGPMLASVLGSLLTAESMVVWYPQLAKPFFTPPNIAFPIAWTFLYALMTVAFWRILRARPETGSKRMAIAVFFGQLLLNIGWSYAFFALRSPILGMLVVSVLMIAVAAMVRSFLSVDRAAGFALMPYLAWVVFAWALNAGIVVLNP